MVTWRFKSAGAWYWQRVDAETDTVIAQAHVGFATLRECVNDAHHYGYNLSYESVSDSILRDPAVSPHRLRPPPGTRY